jgi:hypothetical protein
MSQSGLAAVAVGAGAVGWPGVSWPIWGELGRLYREQGEAGVIIRRLAETIEDDGLQEGFVTAVSAKEVLEKWQNS